VKPSETRPQRLAYLISQYPAVNHTFILREVLCLRSLGWDIQTVSIRGCDRPAEKLTRDEAEEQGRTLYVKAATISTYIQAHAATFARDPVRYAKALAYALRLGHRTPARVVRNAAYFAQAVVTGQWLRRRGIRHMHVHFASTVALIATRLFDTGFSVTIHGPDEFTDPQGFSFAEKTRHASFIVSISDYARSQVMRFSDYRNWWKYDVCRLGISPAVFSPIQARLNADPVRLVCVARLSPVKGQHILIAAVNHAIRLGASVHLTLVGDGPDRASLEAETSRLAITRHVTFAGWQNQDGVQAIYRESDIFVLASFAEGIPVVLMEAMAMEIPCIATNVNGVPELIRDGTDGLLVPASSSEDLAAAIVALARDPARRRSLGESGRRRVLELYDLGRNSVQLSDIFTRRLLNEAGA
jgi:glycosyltransferase involved in cell wall biosynthesis